MDQMTRMNSRVDKIEDFLKTKVQPTIDNKKGKQVSFLVQLPSQTTSNPRYQGALSSQTHNLNHVHANEETLETAPAISNLWSGNDLLDPSKDHPIHQGPIIKNTPNIVKHDSDSDDEEEQTKPLVPYPQ